MLYVQDPVSISFFRFVDGRGVSMSNILVCGERHRVQHGCRDLYERKDVTVIEFPEFLNMYLDLFSKKYPRDVMDVFVESPYSMSRDPILVSEKKKTQEWDYGLGFLRTYLAPCSPKIRRESLSTTFTCPSHTRVHLCDVRLFYQYPFQHNKKLKNLKVFFGMIHQSFPDIVGHVDDYLEFWGMCLFDSQNEYFVLNLWDVCLSELKILRQLSYVDKERREYLLNWGETMWEKYVKRAQTLFQSLSRKSGQDVFLKQLSRFHESTVDIGTVIMDLYVLGRVFRRFRDGTRPRHMILYVGEFHAKKYRKIFHDFGGDQLFPRDRRQSFSKSVIPRDLTSCVNIDGLFQAIGFDPLDKKKT